MSDSNATITRTKLIQRAFRRIGIDSPSTNELGLGVELLNDIIKELDEEGRFLHAVSNTPSTLALVSGQASYDVASDGIPSYMLSLERVEIVRGEGTLEPIRIIDKSESISTYEREGTTGGDPHMVYLERQPNMANQKIWFYPTPSAAVNIQIYFRRPLYDFDNASDNPDVPQSWNQKLVKRLAYELAPEYGVPLAERQLIKAECDEAMKKGWAAQEEKTAEPKPVQATYF